MIFTIDLISPLGIIGLMENQVQNTETSVIDEVTQKIFSVRGRKVMLDIDIASLYGVSTKRLNEQVKRNRERFPDDFMFQLTKEEMENIIASNRSQFATGSQKHRDLHYLPYAFTEHGVAMLSAVLRSEEAVRMNIFIIRAFIAMRESLSHYNDLSSKVAKMELRQNKDGALLYDIYETIRHLLKEPRKKKVSIGFNTQDV